jgi:hypothetical protein
MSDIATKRCTLCKKLLDTELFWRNRTRCKPCLRPQLAAYRDANRHAIRERGRKNYKKDSQKVIVELPWSSEDDPLNYTYPG